MARLVLVNPQLAYSSWRAPVLRSMFDANIKHGLAQLAACLKAEGHSVDLIDLRRLRGWAQFDAIVRKGTWDALGVTANTAEHDDAVECCRRAKRLRPSLRTVAGGIQPTMFPEAFLETGVVDHVLKGEGELSFGQWAADPSRFPAIIQGEPPDISRLPFTDRLLWPDEKERTMFPWAGRFLPVPVVEMIAQRGCPWKCRFCCGPGEQNVFSKVRSRSVSHVMEELEALYARIRFRGVYFHDDEFMIRPRWVEEFCEAMETRGFTSRKTALSVSLRVDSIVKNEDLMRKLKKAGLAIVTIGFESFSDRLLAWMNKGVTRAEQLEAVRILRALDIKISANIMLGLPGPDGVWNPEEDYLTMKTLKQIQPDRIMLAYFSPVPGSYFYQWFKDRGMIVREDFRTLARRGGVPLVKGVNYDFLDALTSRKTAAPLAGAG